MWAFRPVGGMPARLWTLTVERHTTGWAFRIDLGPLWTGVPSMGLCDKSPVATGVVSLRR